MEVHNNAFFEFNIRIYLKLYGEKLPLFALHHHVDTMWIHAVCQWP